MTSYLYKHLAKACQSQVVKPLESITLSPDLILGHDGTGPELLKKWEDGKRIAAGLKVIFTLDHAFPAPSTLDRQFQVDFARFCQKEGCILYRGGEGVLHQVIAENEALGGQVIVGADGHVATAGAFGALAFSVQSEQLAEIMQTGQFRLEVPEQIVISMDSFPAPNVLPRDMAMYIVKELKDQIMGKAVALTGSSINSLSFEGKMAICNYLPEAGVVTAFVLPEGSEDQVDLTLDASHITPLVAAPSSPTSIKKVSEVTGTKVTVALAGSCSAGRVEDMKKIAEILAKESVHPDVTFLITPASRKVLDDMELLGISKIIRDAGAVILPPGCGPCPGKHLGLLKDEDTAITTTIKNTPGRIGSKKAKIFLASPLTVALAAVKGEITVP